MGYVMGMAASVPTSKRAEFVAHCKIAAEAIMEAGALQVAECWGTDVPGGELTSFPMAVKATEDETVILSWIVWPSKDASEAGMQKFMQDPRMDPAKNPMPFDGKRMIFGGFEMVVQA